MDFSPAAVQPKRTPVADVRHKIDRLKADPAKTGRSGSSQIKKKLFLMCLRNL